MIQSKATIFSVVSAATLIAVVIAAGTAFESSNVRTWPAHTRLSGSNSLPSLPTLQSDSQAVVLRFAGDCLLAGHYEDVVGDSVDHAFIGFDLLKTADVAMVNLECPVTTRGQRVTKPYNFRMHPRFLSALSSAGIGVVNIANNHIFDYGKIGLFDTISYLDSLGIRHVGAGRNRTQAHAPVILNPKGRRIALLGYYGGGEAPVASKASAGVADRRIGSIREDVASIRATDSSAYIVVNLHWGTEKADRPDLGQIKFAHSVIDAGVDLVIGHHPHVLQGIERYRTGVIVYSLGNFVFGGKNQGTYNTALFEVNLSTGKTEYRLIPIRLTQWRAAALSDAEAEDVLQHVKNLSKGFLDNIFMNTEVR